ncbi:hypothetical protein N7G274_003550 [Stereocaulon virgatum]|uniref:Uncharacterized protein n=1 Tax=Stereocaulon virgatum TaxID=373712 RepID=A0ABR4AH36_9LECA
MVHVGDGALSPGINQAMLRSLLLYIVSHGHCADSMSTWTKNLLSSRAYNFLISRIRMTEAPISLNGFRGRHNVVGYYKAFAMVKVLLYQLRFWKAFVSLPSGVSHAVSRRISARL